MKNLCCAYCEKRASCSDKCLNDPDKCKMCVTPPANGKEWERTDGYDLPDAPDIALAERTGLKPFELPFDDVDVECPICGKACATIYTDVDGDCCGCENCVKPMDAEEYMREKEEEDDQ